MGMVHFLAARLMARRGALRIKSSLGKALPVLSSFRKEIVKENRKSVPGGPPGRADGRVLGIPLFTKTVKGVPGFGQGGGTIKRP